MQLFIRRCIKRCIRRGDGSGLWSKAFYLRMVSEHQAYIPGSRVRLMSRPGSACVPAVHRLHEVPLVQALFAFTEPHRALHKQSPTESSVRSQRPTAEIRMSVALHTAASQILVFGFLKVLAVARMG